MKKIAILIIILGITLIGVSEGFGASALKKTVAVFDFENDSGYRSVIRLGQDFSEQLSDALVQSKKFIVLNREDLDVVMAEQDLAKSDRFAKAKAAQTGKIVPAQILIKGKIAEFQENTSGGGQGLNISGFKIGLNKSSAHMAVIIQLINSTTGEIIESKRVEGEAKSGGVSLGYSGSFDINSSSFKKTPLGKAVQITIDRAVDFISKKLGDLPWSGKVVMFKEGTVYVNSGENAGIQQGSIFAVYREGEALIDPDTGMDLGSETQKIADIRIKEVKEKFSKAEIIGEAQIEIAKGDLIQEK